MHDTHPITLAWIGSDDDKDKTRAMYGGISFGLVLMRVVGLANT